MKGTAMSVDLAKTINEFRKTHLLQKHGNITAKEAMKRACDNERQALQFSTGDLRRITHFSIRDEYLEIAELLDRSLKPLDVKLTTIQNSLIERAKVALKNMDWYKGISVDLLPETDKEIFEIGFHNVVDILVRDTINQDCPHITAGRNVTIIKQDGKYFVNFYQPDNKQRGTVSI